MPAVNLDALDLAALLSSRVCHDVIGPVAAIVNGLEVLEDEDDISMKEFALDLIKKSARQASARLQFSRLAFGAAGSAGAEIDLGDAEQVAKGFINDDKLSLQWNAERRLLPKNKVKLLLNLILVATNAIPRGGRITADVDFGDSADATRIIVEARGPQARIPAQAQELVAGESASGEVDAHGIQAFYTGLVARAAGLQVSFAIDGDIVTIKAAPASAESV